MSITKEFREFFLRNVKVTSGSKADKEINFPVSYNIVNKGNVFNRFLQNHFPSESVFKKLFESVTFKLNTEDTATITEQGLSRLATDTESATRTEAGAGQFVNTVRPSHLPSIVSGTVGVNDVVVSTFNDKGIIIKTISTFTGVRFKRDFSVEAKVDKSIEFDAITKAIQLVGESSIVIPLANHYYGTFNGVKGFFIVPPIKIKVLDSYASDVGITSTTGINIATNLYTYILPISTFLSNGDEIEVFNYLDYTNGAMLRELYINNVQILSGGIAFSNSQRITVNYTIIYLGVNKALVIGNIEIADTVSGGITHYKESTIITFNPAIANTIQFRTTNTTALASAINIKRAKTTLNLI